MKINAFCILSAAFILQILLSVPTLARDSDSDSEELARALSKFANSIEADQHDKAINRAFKSKLGREPTDRELRRYRNRMNEEHWTEADVRDDLEGRPDHARHSSHKIENPEQVVRRAYQDILHRDPDSDGMRTYRSRIIDDDWSEQDVREALRKSDEYGPRSNESADKIVRRAYQDVLGRAPDTSGQHLYRNKILHEGWDEHDVREALRRSPEFREKSAMTREQAEKIVRRAYLSVLNREPDTGSRGYTERVLHDHWNESDVARELRHSDEYRKNHHR